MSVRTLSNPTLEVNDVVIAIVPNSLVYKNGFGDKSVKVQSSGGNAIETVITEDADNKKSMVKFKLYNTAYNIQLGKDWCTSFDNNIAISEGEIAESFQQMVVVTEPEKQIGADGNLELEFEGAPSL